MIREEIKLEKAKELEKALKDIQNKKGTIIEIFEKYNLNYSKKTYYVLKKKYKEFGLEGLKNKSGRKKDKSTDEIIKLVKELKINNANIKSDTIKEIVKKKYQKEISKSLINQILKKERIRNSRGRPLKIKEKILNCAGSYIFISAVKETKYVELLTKLQKELIEQITEKITMSEDEGAIYKETGIFSKDKKGRFKKYKKERNIGETISKKFSSIQERKKTRNLKRTSINKNNMKTLYKKNMTLLCLSIITNHSKFRELTDTQGNELENISGYNYKYNTIDKYARELKYYEISQSMIKMTGEHFYKIWKEKTGEDLKMVCCYFDGHRKALWSKVKVLKSKVSKTGRVMGCLEQVFVHSVSGHPIMLQTFPGGIYLPEAIKKLQEQLDEFLPEVNMRISIFDGGGNSQDYYETFTDKNYYICILDNNQYKQDLSDFKNKEIVEQENELFIEAKKKFKHKEKENEYYYVRTPIYRGKNNKYIAFITNIPIEELSAQEIINMYYRRWPCQELSFKDMNMGVDLSTNYGYGKVKITNVVVSKKKNFLKEKISKRKEHAATLEKKLKQLKLELESETKIAKEMKKNNENQIKEIEKKLKKTNENKEMATMLKEIKNSLEKLNNKKIITNKTMELKNEISKILTNKKENDRLLNKHQKEYERIYEKEKVYKNDVELDQIMGMFKIAFTNICAYILKEYFQGIKPITMENLITKVFKREGKMIISGNNKDVYIYLNEKDKQMGELIKKACDKINEKMINHSKTEIITLVPKYRNKNSV